MNIYVVKLLRPDGTKGTEYKFDAGKAVELAKVATNLVRGSTAIVTETEGHMYSVFYAGNPI